MVQAANQKTHWIGIDLGTTNSCVGLWSHGTVEILQNEEGANTTPSVVSFRSDEEVVGMRAFQQAARATANTIYDSKRLIGRRFTDSVVQEDRKLWPFKVTQGAKQRCQIMVNIDGNERQFHPEDISARILAKMKQFAETKTGGVPVKNAVVTVPAYFNDSQRQATIDACTIAGLDCKRIINEPTAAAIAYGLNKMQEDAKKILVYDLGGGTLDVSVLNIEAGLIEVLSTRGDTHLGGQDIDQLLVKYCISEYSKKHQQDLTKNSRAKARLYLACNRAKCLLSSSHSAEIDVPLIDGENDFVIDLSRGKFEEICQPIWQRCMQPLSLALSDAKLDKNQVDEIVLVGGSTRIPKVQKILSDHFEGKNLYKQLNPDEVVAYGATIQAGILSGDQTQSVEDILLLDVAPLSLGIQVLEGTEEMTSVLIPRNTSIPFEKTKDYVTAHDDQTSFGIKVLQGEAKLARENHKIGQFTVDGVQPMPQGRESVDVTFCIDANGVLRVTAKYLRKGTENSIVIQADTISLEEKQVQRLTEQFQFEQGRQSRRKQQQEREMLALEASTPNP